ncbi:MAG: DUF2723 domain-containing protein, partial [Candidatus Woesearchaeota archaeon]
MKIDKLAVISLFIPLLIYLVTLAPTVYWGDSGELITAIHTLSIPHPSGYPTYILLGKLFTLLPFGTVAFKANLFSAVFAALTCLLVFLICLHITKSAPASMAAAFIFAFSKTFWGQAVVAEVYTMHAFFLALNIYLLLEYTKTHEPKYLYLFTFCFGLSLTHHITSILFAPAYLILLLKNQQITKHIPLCAVLFIVSLTPYIYLPIRSAMNPVIDWNNPENLSNLITHITGKEYHYLLKITEPPISDFFSQFYSEVGILAMLFGIIGIAALKKPSRATVAFAGIICITSFYGLLYRITDIGNYISPIILAYTFFIAIGLNNVFAKFKLTSKSILAIALLLILFPLISNYTTNNKSNYLYAYHYGLNVLNVLENNSILIGRGDNDLGIFSYLQNVEGKRKDITFVEMHLLVKPWFFNKVADTLHLDPNGKIFWSYTNRTHADQTISLFLNQLLTKNIHKRPIYATFLDIDTEYSLNIISQVAKVQNQSQLYPFTTPAYPYVGIPADYYGRHQLSLATQIIGINALQNSEWNAAIEYLAYSTELQPKNVPALNNLAIAYIKTNQPQKALDTW